MDNYDEIFKRDIDRLVYLFVKANTKSKLRNIGYDLIFFENMYNCFSDYDIEFPWSYNEILMDLRADNVCNMLENALSLQKKIYPLVVNSFNIFVDSEFSIYKDYKKKYHKLDEYLFQKYLIDFFDDMGSDLRDIFIDKIKNNEIFFNSNIKRYDGVYFPLECINKSYILIASGNILTLDDARILAHEMGHNFEFINAYNSGISCIWNNVISKTIFSEVSSCFFEYSFINYLIENNIYLEDSVKLKRKYLNQIYYFLGYLLIIFTKSTLSLDSSLMVTIDDDDVVKYANGILEVMNSYDDKYKLGDKISFNNSFIYGMGKLLGVYLYESYKDNSYEFLNNFKKSLLEYKDNDFDAFNRVGVSYQDLLKGDTLKKILKK